MSPSRGCVITPVGMCDHSGLEIVADNTERNAAEILKHMDIAVDPCLLVHVQAGLNVCKLAVRQCCDKEIDWMHLTLFGIVQPHRFTAPIYFAYNTGLVGDVVREIVLLNVLGVIATEFSVADRNAVLYTVLVLVPKQLERDSVFFSSLWTYS